MLLLYKLLLKKYQKKIDTSNALFQFIEKERLKVSSKLHEDINHELLALRNSKTNDVKSIDILINHIRDISRDLYPIMFERVGLVLSIEQLLEEIKGKYDIVLSYDISYYNSLSLTQELHIFRIIQEAVINVIKHSKAIATKITLTENNTYIFIEIKDNGIGFNPEILLHPTTSLGLKSIFERITIIGGTPNLISNAHGTIITCTINKNFLKQ